MYQECRHIMPSGLKCHSPALGNAFFCYYHTSLHRTTAPKGKFDNQGIEISALEDSSAVQLALTQVLGALGSSSLDPRRAGLLLYGLQIAAHLTARPSAQKPADSVRTVCYAANGEALAPEKTICEPPADCANCLKHAGCDDYELYFDDEGDEEEGGEEDEEEGA